MGGWLGVVGWEVGDCWMGGWWLMDGWLGDCWIFGWVIVGFFVG